MKCAKIAIISLLIAFLLAPAPALSALTPVASPVASPFAEGCDQVISYIDGRNFVASILAEEWEAQFGIPFVTELSAEEVEQFFDKADAATFDAISALFTRVAEQQRTEGLPPILAAYANARAAVYDAFAELFLAASLVGPGLAFLLFNEDVAEAYEHANQVGLDIGKVCPPVQIIVEYDISMTPDFVTADEN